MAEEINATTWLSPNPALPPGDELRERRPVAGTVAALLAALLFGGAGPFAKSLLPPGGGGEIALAGLLYAAAGAGLGLIVLALRAAKIAKPDPRPLARTEWTALFGTAFLGGLLAPILLMLGLARTSGTSASLLLAAEMPLTAFVALAFLKDRLDRASLGGAAGILAGSALVALGASSDGDTSPIGVLCILGCTAAWSGDTGLTSRLAGRDPLAVATWKCVLAAPVVLVLALVLGQPLAALLRGQLLLLLVTGIVGYGLSISMFVLAIRWIGVARTGALFGTAPLLGAGVAVAWLGEIPTVRLALAATLMAAGTATIFFRTLKTRSPAPTPLA
jgi:drug/metabolite transporter (DMT)-like permease